MASRDFRIRYSKNRQALTIQSLIRPFMYINKQFGFPTESIYRRFRTQSDAYLGIYPNTFPNNIAELFWIQEGQPTLIPWIAVGKLTSGLFFYYTAFCLSSTGEFWKNGKPTGHMNLWLSPVFSDIIQSSMDGTTYVTYINDTLPSDLENQ